MRELLTKLVLTPINLPFESTKYKSIFLNCISQTLIVKRLINVLAFTVVITLVIVSILIIVVINIDFFDKTKYAFSFTPNGIEAYLNKYGKYGGLFTLAIASAAAFSGLRSLGESIRANQDRLKQDRFTEWKNAVSIRIKEIEDETLIIRLFAERRYHLFSVLYGYKFELLDKNQLVTLFDIMRDMVPSFEKNSGYYKFDGVYQNNEYSYYYSTFEFVFLGGLDKKYPGVENDLKALYLGCLPANRIIDKVRFKETLEKKRWNNYVC